jgi:hypothetical protein
VSGDEGEKEVRVLGDPTKMRVQVYYDTEKFTLGLRLVDQGSGDSMMAEIDPDLAMTVGEKMFKIGSDMKARKQAS